MKITSFIRIISYMMIIKIFHAFTHRYDLCYASDLWIFLIAIFYIILSDFFSSLNNPVKNLITNSKDTHVVNLYSYSLGCNIYHTYTRHCSFGDLTLRVVGALAIFQMTWKFIWICFFSFFTISLNSPEHFLHISNNYNQIIGETHTPCWS